MKQIILLIVLLLAMISLNAELVVEISPQMELNPPYAFDEYIYNGSDEVHFYRSEIENGSINLYHFSLQEIDYAQYQYTDESLIASVDIGNTGIENFELRQVYGSDCVHVVYYSDYYIKRVTMLSDYAQLTGSVDLSSFAIEIERVTSACDSLIVVDKYIPGTTYEDDYIEHYKCNLITGNLELMAGSTDNYYFSGRFGSYVGIMGVENAEETGSFALYDNQLNLIGYPVPSPDTDDPYIFQSVLDASVYFEQVPFADGFISFGGGGIILENPNLIYTYFTIENNVMHATEIREFLPGLWSVLEFGSVYGFAGGYPGGGPTFFYYLTYDGSEWTEVVSEISSNGTRPIVINWFYITSYVVDNSMHFTVYDQGEIGWQQEVEITAPVGYQAENFFDQLFYIDITNNTICYFIYDFTYPNVDNENPTFEKLLTASNFPNPFNPETTIEYSIPEAGQIEISIFNLRGQKVNTLVNTVMTKGSHSVVWDGTDSMGQSVTSGIYMYRIVTNNASITKKIVLMK